MKMKVGTRVVLTIYLIAVIALCGFILATLGGLITGSNLSELTNTVLNGASWVKVIYAVRAVVVLGDYNWSARCNSVPNHRILGNYFDCAVRGGRRFPRFAPGYPPDD